MSNTRLILGDCLDAMAGMDANSIDSIVTDPPYGLSFMGKDWDHGVPGVPFWEAALRVAKPGAHLLAFGGDRTHHRLMVAIEDAGWEIRTCLYWIFGSGFPKSHSISKAIDRMAGAERQNGKMGGNGPFEHTGRCANCGKQYFSGSPCTCPRLDLISATDAAKQWDGWGSGLKPAAEIIVMARKKLDGTIAQNVLRHGVGGLNVDGCRIPLNDYDINEYIPNRCGWKDGIDYVQPNNSEAEYRQMHSRNGNQVIKPQGRWPANLILDESAAASLDEMSGESKSTDRPRNNSRTIGGNGKYNGGVAMITGGHSDSGGASRFFYVAKASRRDRNEGLEGMPKRGNAEREGRNQYKNGTPLNGSGQLINGDGHIKPKANFHPCVKPTQLMRYLVRLVTPPGGTVLDPFAGSGSTLKAAILEGFDCVGIELDPEYLAIAQARCAHAQSQARMQLPLLEVA